MSYLATIVSVLLSCPGDIPEADRHGVDRAVRSWNSQHGSTLGYNFEISYWKQDAVATITDRAQGSLNEQIVDPSMFGLVLLWSRVGTPTGSFKSGVDEEIHRLLDNKRLVAVFEKTTDVPRNAVASAVEAKKYVSELQEMGALTRDYDSPESLEQLVAQQLTSWASSLGAVPRTANSGVSPATGPPPISGSRPAALAYRSRNGIYLTHFPDPGQPAEFHDLFRSVVDWHDGSGQFGALDTFLTDGWTHWSIAKMLSAADKSNGGVRLLLSHPDSEYTRMRADALGHLDPSQRSLEGLEQLASALASMKRSDQTRPADQSVVPFLQTLIRDVPLEVRFYDGVPSGPMYFIGDLLLVGRYPARGSSVETPWHLVVDDPNVDQDLFGSHLEEYEEMWSSATPLGEM